MSLLDMDMSDEIYERSIIEEWVNNLPNIRKDFLSYSEIKNIYYSACTLSYNIDDCGNIPNLVKSINFTPHQLVEMLMHGIDENSHIPNICFSPFSPPYPKFRLVKLSGNKLPVSDIDIVNCNNLTLELLNYDNLNLKCDCTTKSGFGIIPTRNKLKLRVFGNILDITQLNNIHIGKRDILCLHIGIDTPLYEFINRLILTGKEQVITYLEQNFSLYDNLEEFYFGGKVFRRNRLTNDWTNPYPWLDCNSIGLF